MRLFIHYGLCFLLLILLIPFQAFSTEAKRKPRFARTCPLVRAAAPRQAPTLKISQQNPVVNETKQVTLTAVDGDGNPLTDVAWESGYENIPHFIKEFHKRYGITPKQFLIENRTAALV